MARKIALVGMPNTGKSTLFNRLTGGNAHVANWPGLTVELASARLLLGSQMAQLIDLPGIYDLRGGAEDEQVAQSMLSSTELNGVLLVLNATQLDRQLGLALQLKHLGARLVLALNMADEVRQAGGRIDLPALAAALDCPVISISAKHGEGMNDLRQALQQLLAAPPAAALDVAQAPLADTWHAAESELYRRHVQQAPTLNAGATARLDHWLLHPLLGIPLFVLMMYLLFQLTYTLGAPLQDELKLAADALKSLALQTLSGALPAFWHGLLLDGIYDGVVTVLTFAPIIFLFFCLMAMIEDSGYFARAAFMMDGLMARVGLDGRSFVMLMMGFGCNVPALMGTRVIRDRKARLLTMLTIPFSLCSARLQIFLFLAGALYSPVHAGLVVLSLYLASIVIAMGTAALYSRRFSSCEPFALELPPYRLPIWQQVLRRGMQETRAFLRLASSMIVLGVALVWLLTHYPNAQHSYAGMVADWFQPILAPIGISAILAIALIFGFVAKEIVLGALAVIVGHDGGALASHLARTLDPISAYSFMLFTLTYVPCVSTIATLRKESRSNAFTAFSVVWSLGLAWLLSFVFYQGARALGF
ncbi:ferrous iron transport protein B [Andreprevotia lacus DSM 23236]|jgi:ferrous iron transport protein B|uniref:Ferrous iron transport protein B n=1 Tax=Andreprevotia lacus DSM 23236 TaxID=1121001 RepID=A0A1W1WYP8_9NEIS|nr:ferrous iron transport protein B [Andreprevotia lacus]SMC16839.1 ferrous iron transport protein B [Andreprevotia lacus DSM 23236]